MGTSRPAVSLAFTLAKVGASKLLYIIQDSAKRESEQLFSSTQLAADGSVELVILRCGLGCPSGPKLRLRVLQFETHNGRNFDSLKQLGALRGVLLPAGLPDYIFGLLVLPDPNETAVMQVVMPQVTAHLVTHVTDGHHWETEGSVRPATPSTARTGATAPNNTIPSKATLPAFIVIRPRGRASKEFGALVHSLYRRWRPGAVENFGLRPIKA